MNRSLIMSIALISLIAMGSPAMADRGVRPLSGPGNSAAARADHTTVSDPNCLGDVVRFLATGDGFVVEHPTGPISDAFDLAAVIDFLGGDCSDFLFP